MPDPVHPGTRGFANHSNSHASALLGTTSVEIDRETLVVLYNGTDGPNWHYNQNWLTGAPLGEWEGITTDEDGRVVDVDMGCNR